VAVPVATAAVISERPARSRDRSAEGSVMEFHEIASCWPVIEGEDFDKLVEDIRARAGRESRS